MMVWAAPGVPRPIDPSTRRVAYRLALSYRVVASANPTHERSAVRRSTVAGHDYVACPCVLQAPRYTQALLGNA
jgi:hypothetical protein